MLISSLKRVYITVVVSFCLIAASAWAIPAGVVLTLPQDMWHFRCGNFIDVSQASDVEALVLSTEKHYFESVRDGGRMTFEKNHNEDPRIVVAAEGDSQSHRFSELVLLPGDSKIWITRSEGPLAMGQSLIGAYVPRGGVLMTADRNWIALCRSVTDSRFRFVRSFLSRLSVPLNEIIFELRSCQMRLVSKAAH